MKLYDYQGAPNPRRVKIFAAEKGAPLELIPCDMMKREHKTPEFLQKNPSGKLPVLELDDGRCIPESVAICRYLEEMYPEPNLLGEDAYERAWIDARNRHIEFELWSQVGTSWVNGPIVGAMGLFEQVPAAKELSDKGVRNYYRRLDDELSRAPYVAGDRYTIADITLLSAVDFASAMVDLKPDPELAALWSWHQRVSERPAVAAN